MKLTNTILYFDWLHYVYHSFKLISAPIFALKIKNSFNKKYE